MTFQRAVGNSEILFEAAKRAGIQRVVHVSVTNPDEESPLPYFRGKGLVERALKESGLSYAIIRPAILFAPEDILINNIAWTLRRLPAFGVFGDGEYRLQPIYVDDFARLALEQGASRENCIVDAIGPETFTYRELARTIGEIIGRPCPIVSVPPRLGQLVGWVLGKLMRDVMITGEEIDGLMADLLHTESLPAGDTRLSSWAREHRETLGLRYASELGRRRDRTISYLAG
jgi:NADH dehydrogenase